MTTRVSNEEVYRTVLNNLFAATRRMEKLQDQVSSGRRIRRPSDDPAGASIALGHRVNLSLNGQHQRSSQDAVARLNASEAALATATSALQRARELAISAGSPSASAAQLLALGTEVNQVLESVVQTANSNFAGTYIFAGQKTMTPAFSTTVVGGLVTAVTYQGDGGPLTREVSTGVRVDINVLGDQVFSNLIASLITLRDALNAGDGVGAMAEIANLDTGLDVVLEARGTLGAKTNAVEAVQVRLLESNVQLKTEKAEIEEIDVPDIVVQLTAQENVYQAALAATARVIGPSLLDFLR